MALSLVLSSCAKSEFASTLEDVDKGIIKKSEKPYCEVDATDYILYPKIQSFDITSKKHGSFGFNLITGALKAFGFKFTTSTGEVWVTTSVFSPLSYNENILPEKNPHIKMGSQRASATDKSFEFEIEVGKFNVGFDSYKKTPISRLTQEGLDKSLKHAIDQLKDIEDQWSTKVADVVNDYAIIQSGKAAGLREGDKLEFYNVTYAWKGEPCSGELLMPVPTTTTPIAIGVVKYAYMNAAALTIEQLLPNETIELGTLVRVHQLKQEGQDPRRLLRSVKVIDMPANPWPVENQTLTVDFSIFANIQFRSMLNENGFYMKQ